MVRSSIDRAGEDSGRKDDALAGEEESRTSVNKS